MPTKAKSSRRWSRELANLPQRPVFRDEWGRRQGRCQHTCDQGQGVCPAVRFCLRMPSTAALQCVWQGDARFTARSAAAIQLWGQSHRQRLTQVRRSVLGRRPGHCVQHLKCAGAQDEVEKAACLPALLSLLEEGSQEEKLGAVGCLAQLLPAAGGPGAIMVLEQVRLSPLPSSKPLSSHIA